jgi:hypothetical protein
MVIDYKKVLLQNVIDAMGMGFEQEDEMIKQAIEWTIDDCMNNLNNQLKDYVATPEFSETLERVK